MRFREGRLGDLEQLVAHGEEFWTHTTYYKRGREYSPEAVAGLCSYLITEDDGFIIVLADDEDNVKGFGLVLVTPFIFDQTWKSALELAYYIDPECRGTYGVKLLKKMEKIAKLYGAEFMTMITMEDSAPEQAARIYDKLGYTKNEVLYTKELHSDGIRIH